MSAPRSAPAHDLTPQVVEAAQRLGFVGVAITGVEPLARGQQALRDWLHQGFHGDMAYMADPTPNQRADPRHLLEEAKSLIVVALPYGPAAPQAPDAQPRARIARYALGEDYHGVMKERLRVLADQIGQLCAEPVLARPCVDSAPLLEREAAHQAGLGFIAKNTLTILPGVGSYVFLGELLLSVELTPTATEPARERCGQCTACLDACPTGAFVSPRVLDARRCISYLTIELRGPIPADLRPLMGDWVFGCDVCQEVCPFNVKAKAGHPAFEPRQALSTPLLTDLLSLGASAHKRLVKGTALRRASRHQLARNAAVALGNRADPATVPHLAKAVREHINPMVRGHAAWALGRIGGEEARRALQEASHDEDPTVREEAAAALGQLHKEALPPEGTA